MKHGRAPGSTANRASTASKSRRAPGSRVMESLSQTRSSRSASAQRGAPRSPTPGHRANSADAAECPWPNPASASFQETDQLLGSFDVSPFRIDKQKTRLTLSPTSFSGVWRWRNAVRRQSSPTRRGESRAAVPNRGVCRVRQRPDVFHRVDHRLSGSSAAGTGATPGGYWIPVRASFGGTVDVGGGQSLVLENDRYRPVGSNTATLTLNRDDSPPSCSSADRDG